jgi:hypothetical protein
MSSVSFAAGTKTHDGPSPAGLLLQELIIRADAENTFTEQALVRFLKKMPQRARLFPFLIPRLYHLVVQLGTAARNHVYVIPVSNGLMIPVSHFGQLKTLYELCVNTFRRVREVYFRRKQKTVASDAKSELGDQKQNFNCNANPTETVDVSMC